MAVTGDGPIPPTEKVQLGDGVALTVTVGVGLTVVVTDGDAAGVGVTEGVTEGLAPGLIVGEGETFKTGAPGAGGAPQINPPAPLGRMHD